MPFCCVYICISIHICGRTALLISNTHRNIIYNQRCWVSQVFHNSQSWVFKVKCRPYTLILPQNNLTLPPPSYGLPRFEFGQLLLKRCKPWASVTAVSVFPTVAACCVEKSFICLELSDLHTLLRWGCLGTYGSITRSFLIGFFFFLVCPDIDLLLDRCLVQRRRCVMPNQP